LEVAKTPSDDENEFDESLERLKTMLDEIPEITDEEVLINLLRQGSFDAISKYLVRKNLSFDEIKKYKTVNLDKFLENIIVAISKKDLELFQQNQSAGLTLSEKKEILKDLIQFNRKEKQEIQEILKQLRA
jgi:hypothetical protein